MSIQVHTTRDYSVFKLLQGNRDVNKVHISRLRESMKKKPLTTVILVNENLEIIDGQHRFMVSKELGLPINYIVERNYGLVEVQILNANMKNWSINDYVQGYCDLGIEDYEIFKRFKNEYGFSNQVSMTLLSGQYNSGNETVSLSTKFKEGEFEVKDLSLASRMAEDIMLLEPFYDGFRRRSFVFSMIGMFKNENFDFISFLSKIKQQPTKMKDCTNITQYKELIEEIYNYRRRPKVNLRF